MSIRSTIMILGLLLYAASASAQFPIENAFPNLDFTRPVDLQHAGDGSNRLFVVEQVGRIEVFVNDASTSNREVFLDITDLVNDAGNEEGLLGLAFHPEYAENGFFYVNYTAADPRRTVIARYSVSAADENRADPASALILLTIAQPFSNHNGGQIAFGPDGYLYIATGDGGSGGDPQNNGQNRATLLGKLLRIDVDNTGGGREYAIPEDNPFVGNNEGWAEEIYAWGLRNPWRFSFDRESGRLWCADVGQNRAEEIDIIEKGKNYGWRIMEGFSCFNPSSGCDQTGLSLPVLEYGRSLGRSVTGGFVYRGKHVPELEGKYIYADFVSGRIWGLTYRGPEDADNQLLLSSGQNISAFGIDESDELYICTFGGSIFRFTPTITTQVEDISGTAEGIRLTGGYPNPALQSETGLASFSYSLTSPGRARLLLFDTLGRIVRVLSDEERFAGTHHLDVRISDLRPGVYFISLQTRTRQLARKLVVME